MKVQLGSCSMQHSLKEVCVCVCLYMFFMRSTGSMIERITVFCSSAQELQEWLESLQPFTKGGSPAGTISKVMAHSHKYTHTHMV